MLARISLRDQGEQARTEWHGLVDGVKNNQPAIHAEWLNFTAVGQKRFFQDVFGAELAMKMRAAKYGALKFGRLTGAAADRFGIKLGKALYYRHMQQLFEGDIYVRLIDPFLKTKNPALFKEIIDMAPGVSLPARNTKSLAYRFAYRFNYSTEIGVIYTVAQFGPQLTFSIMAARRDTADQLRKDTGQSNDESISGVFRCSLNPE